MTHMHPPKRSTRNTNAHNRGAEAVVQNRENSFGESVSEAAARLGLGQKSAAHHLLGIAVDLLGSEGCLRHLRRVSRASSPTPCRRPPASAGETGAAARSAKATRPEEKGSSNLKFHGPLGLIKHLTWKAGVRGVWTAKPNGTWCFKLRNGAGLNWSSTKGAAWFDGPAEPRNKLQSVMEAAINRQVYPEGTAASRNAGSSARQNR